MRAVLAAAVALLALAAAGSAGEVRQQAAADPIGRLLGISCHDCPHGPLLQWFHPLTLRPLPGRRLRLDIGESLARSPDRRRLLLADEQRGSIRLIDIARLRVGWRAEVSAEIAALRWLRSGRIVALVDGWRTRYDLEATVVDPARRRLLPGGRVEGASATHTAASARHLVALLAGPEEGAIGATQVAIVDEQGCFRRTRVERVPTGFAGDGELLQPALAVDPTGERAVVIAASAPVAEIDLETGVVSYHKLRRKTGLLERLRGWLEPAAHAKGPVEGSFRDAVWLPNGLIAVTGDDRYVVRRTHEIEELTIPAGLQLIDPADWSVRTLHERSDSLAVAGRTLVAWTNPHVAVPDDYRMIGVTAYSLDGDRRFELFPGKPISSLQAVRRYAYAAVGWFSGIQVVDLATGRVVRRLRLASRPLLLP
jgi:hypothetical protein